MHMKYKFCRVLIIFSLVIFSPSTVFAAKKDGLNEAMMGENISGGFGDFSIQRRNAFAANSNEVIWFASFKGFMGAPEAKLRAEWITPAGETFKDENFTTKYGNSRFGWAKLDIKGVDRQALELKGEWTVNVYWDADLIDTQKFYMGERKFKQVAEVATAAIPQTTAKAAGVSSQEGGRFVRTMAGNQVVYEGPEKSDPALWRIEKTPFNELKMAGPQNASKSIAVLAYPYNLDIVSTGMAFDRGKHMANEIKKSGFAPGSIRKENTLPEQYKYLLRHNRDQKRTEVNFFSQSFDVDFNLVEFSEEKDKVRNVVALLGNGMFPHDLSGHVSRKTVEKLTQNGYQVLDLTASRDELSGKKLDEILRMVHEKYGVDKVMFIPINAYTKWVWQTGTGTRIEIGLLMCYSAAIFERDKLEPVFTFTENVDAGDVSHGFLGSTRKTISPTRINFYSEDWSEDRKIHPDRPIKFYKDGVLDDAWAASVVLGKFAGEQMYSVKDAKLVHVGGALFEKLGESGLLSQTPQRENVIVREREEGSSYIMKKTDLTDSQGNVLFRLFPGASCKVVNAGEEKTEVEVAGKIHKYDVEDKSNGLVKIKKDCPRFLWPKTWSKTKSDNYYLSSGEISRKELGVDKDVTIVSEDDDFLTISARGFVDQRSITKDFDELSKKGNISGTLVEDGQPAKGIEARVSDEWLKTDDAGKYKFEKLMPGKEYKLYIRVREGNKTPQIYVSLINLPVLGPGEDLVYSPVNIRALENSSPEDQVAVISDGYVTEKNGLTAMLPRFVPSHLSSDRLLSAEMTIKAAADLKNISKETLREDFKKIQ